MTTATTSERAEEWKKKWREKIIAIFHRLQNKQISDTRYNTDKIPRSMNYTILWDFEDFLLSLMKY